VRYLVALPLSCNSHVVGGSLEPHSIRAFDMSHRPFNHSYDNVVPVFVLTDFRQQCEHDVALDGMVKDFARCFLAAELLCCRYAALAADTRNPEHV